MKKFMMEMYVSYGAIIGFILILAGITGFLFSPVTAVTFISVGAPVLVIFGVAAVIGWFSEN